jgi:hypothetical protein
MEDVNWKDAYHYECCCGERFKTILFASSCKKCRNYSVWGYTKYVINTVTDEVVHGTMPTDEEYRVQAAIAEKQWAEEQAMRQQQQEDDDRQFLIEQEAARQEVVDAEEDQLFNLQDRMMGLV